MPALPSADDFEKAAREGGIGAVRQLLEMVLEGAALDSETLHSVLSALSASHVCLSVGDLAGVISRVASARDGHISLVQAVSQMTIHTDLGAVGARLLACDNPEVRQAAIEQRALFRSPITLGSLIYELAQHDPNTGVRATAIVAVAQDFQRGAEVSSDWCGLIESWLVDAANDRLVRTACACALFACCPQKSHALAWIEDSTKSETAFWTMLALLRNLIRGDMTELMPIVSSAFDFESAHLPLMALGAECLSTYRERAFPIIRNLLASKNDIAKYWLFGCLERIGPAATQFVPDLSAVISNWRTYQSLQEGDVCYNSMLTSALPNQAALALCSIATERPQAHIDELRMAAELDNDIVQSRVTALLSQCKFEAS